MEAVPFFYNDDIFKVHWVWM